MSQPHKPHKPPQPPIPSRHGVDLPHARRINRGLLHFITDKAAAEPSAERWALLGQALNEGDPQADALVAWMHAQGISQARGWFEQALAQGVDSVPNAPEPLRAFFAHVEQTPAWLDPVRLQRGARAMHLSGHTGMRVLRDATLMAGYQAGAINKTLVMTGALEKGAA